MVTDAQWLDQQIIVSASALCNISSRILLLSNCVIFLLPNSCYSCVLLFYCRLRITPTYRLCWVLAPMLQWRRTPQRISYFMSVRAARTCLLPLPREEVRNWECLWYTMLTDEWRLVGGDQWWSDMTPWRSSWRPSSWRSGSKDVTQVHTVVYTTDSHSNE